jgi:hypothetical protein
MGSRVPQAISPHLCIEVVNSCKNAQSFVSYTGEQNDTPFDAVTTGLAEKWRESFF